MHIADDHDFEQIMVSGPKGEEIILTKVQEEVHGFLNSCPHIGIGLDYGDGDCLFEPGVLVCSMHGALFEADSGTCISGPCAGQSLTRLPIVVTNGRIEIIEDSDAR